MCYLFCCKRFQTRSRGNLRLYNVGAPWIRIVVDGAVPFPSTEVGKYFMFVMDYFTMWPEVFVNSKEYIIQLFKIMPCARSTGSLAALGSSIGGHLCPRFLNNITEYSRATSCAAKIRSSEYTNLGLNSGMILLEYFDCREK